MNIRYFYIAVLSLFILSFISCLKVELEQEPFVKDTPSEIVFGAVGLSEQQTKAEDVTSLSSFNVGCVTGALGSQSSVWNNVTFSQDGTSYKGGKVWPASDNGYKFFASNAPLVFNAGGTRVTATNDTDVVCAYLSSPDYAKKNVLNFEHIFANLNSITVDSNLSLSDVDIRITPKTGGTYNIAEGYGHDDDTGWSSISEGSIQTVADEQDTFDVDLLTVPGEYTIVATWTVGGETFTNYEASLTLTAGHKTDLTVTLNCGKIFLDYNITPYSDEDYRENTDYLTFYAAEAGTIGWICSDSSLSKTIQYSKDFGETWTDLTSTEEGATFAVDEGDIVWFKGNNTAYSYDEEYNCFTMSNDTYVYGNVNSLISSMGNYCFKNLFYNCTKLKTYEYKRIILPATTLAGRCYSNLFYGCTSLTQAPELPATTLTIACYTYMFYGCTSLTKAPELPATTLASRCYYNMFFGCTSLTEASELPAITLADRCYSGMFYNCTSLTEAPELPATTLADRCYYSMFNNCTSLTEAPELPATTLADRCYYLMFYGCTSLTKAPGLPATTLVSSCYQYMFSDCTSLTQAPKLPATTLVSNCYQGMFQRCTSLTVAPELPATTLAPDCYSRMFYNCSSLSYINASFITEPSTSYTNNWVENVSATGTFVKNPSATWDVAGTEGVPSGWIIQEGDEDDYLVFDLTGAVEDLFFVTTNPSFTRTIQYSIDNGVTWNNYESEDESSPVGKGLIGEVVWVRGFNTEYSNVTGTPPGDCSGDYCYFKAELDACTIKYYGDVSALIGWSDTAGDGCFTHLFDGFQAELNPTKGLKLPSPGGEYAFAYMFANSYVDYLTSLVLSENLTDCCYMGMFEHSQLVNAPQLPATILADGCYAMMFKDCPIRQAPELPALTLQPSCYEEMFYGCYNMTYLKAMFTTTPGVSYTKDWLLGASTSGLFYKNSSASWDVTGDSGVPAGWLVKTVAN